MRKEIKIISYERHVYERVNQMAQSSNTTPHPKKKVILLINVHIFLFLICYIKDY